MSPPSSVKNCTLALKDDLTDQSKFQKHEDDPNLLFDPGHHP